MVRRLAAGGGVLVLASSPAMPAAQSPVRAAVYCTQDARGEWRLQRFKPLINAQGGTVFAELSFAGSVLEEVRVRRFDALSEVTLDYRFDRAGRLAGLHGTVTVKTPPQISDGERMLFADWVGEAELTPGSDGKIPAHHVMYRRETDKIDKPEDAERYIGQFDSAPVYTTIASVPCAAMRKEAERMNATQE